MFGTDGIRGIYGEKITPMLFYALGLALAEVFGGNAVVARDTRNSGEELLKAVTDGMTAGGVNVIVGDIAPSPALAKAVGYFGADFGVMITASHNPPEYNGIKVFDRFGCKINREKERLIEFYLTHPPKRRVVRGTRRKEDMIFMYAEGLKSRFGKNASIDYGFGAGCAVKEYSDAYAFNSAADGDKINVNCGALHPEFLLGSSTNDWGFALDGDADRLAVIYKGKILDGDSVLYNLALACGCDKVVATVMSNSALIEELKKQGIETLITPVGDKFVSERMRETDCELGGEQSGHYIISAQNATGDALGAAAFLYRAFEEREPIRLELYPQISFDYPKAIAALPEFDGKVAEFRAKFDGRIVIRLSGTEPKVRFMAENKDERKLKSFVDELRGFLDSLLQKTIKGA